MILTMDFMDSSDISYAIFSWQRADWIPGSGGLQALSFAGIITSLCLIKYKNDIRFYMDFCHLQGCCHYYQVSFSESILSSVR